MKKAFSLIELLIVIVIMGVVYTLAVTKLQSVGEVKPEPSLSTLKEYLISYMGEEKKNVKLVCLDECSSCSVYVDGKKTKDIESFFDTSIETYRYDFLQGLVRVKDVVFFNTEGSQENVCFSLSVTDDKVAQQFVVVYKDKVYDYRSYFSKTKVYENIQEYIDEKQKYAQEVMQ